MSGTHAADVRKDEPGLSKSLSSAETLEARKAAWERHLSAPAFESESDQVAEMLQRGDVDAVVSYAGGKAASRASAHAQKIRDGR